MSTALALMLPARVLLLAVFMPIVCSCWRAANTARDACLIATRMLLLAASPSDKACAKDGPARKMPELHHLLTLSAQCMRTCKQMPQSVPVLDGMLYLEAAAQQRVHWLYAEQPSEGTGQLGRSEQRELLQ